MQPCRSPTSLRRHPRSATGIRKLPQMPGFQYPPGSCTYTVFEGATTYARLTSATSSSAYVGVFLAPVEAREHIAFAASGGSVAANKSSSLPLFDVFRKQPRPIPLCSRVPGCYCRVTPTHLAPFLLRPAVAPLGCLHKPRGRLNVACL